jgi:hypothetical protein
MGSTFPIVRTKDKQRIKLETISDSNEQASAILPLFQKFANEHRLWPETAGRSAHW